MRIGIDARMFRGRFTGIGRYTFELVKHVLMLDEENTYVLFLNDPDYDCCPFANANLERVLVNARHYSVREQTIFCKRLLDARLDLMHFTHLNAPVLYRKKCIVTLHDLTLSFFPGKKMNSPLYRAAYKLTLGSIVRKASKIIAVSEHTRKDIRSLYPAAASKITVIHESVDSSFSPDHDVDVTDRVRRTYGLSKPFLLFTGVWRDHKNVPGLIKAFKQVREVHGFDCLLVITGKEDPHYPEVKKTTLDLGLEEHVRFVGMVAEEQLRALYAMARVYVFPSFYEGFGLPPLEAMASGTAVACSNASSLPEICGKGNAVFFDPHDTEEMAAVIAKVFSDAALRDRLRANGRRRIKEFSWEAMARKTREIYLSHRKK